jgi:hypothetical protein
MIGTFSSTFTPELHGPIRDHESDKVDEFTDAGVKTR